MVELIALFATALNDLGAVPRATPRGKSFAALVEAAEGRAERLVRALAEMPLYRDVSVYDDFEVPFYKRAQITVADLALAFGGEGSGASRISPSSPLFADNLVPHVLRMEGVLHYRQRLGERIDARRAARRTARPRRWRSAPCGLHAVEQIVAAIRARGGDATCAGASTTRSGTAASGPR